MTESKGPFRAWGVPTTTLGDSILSVSGTVVSITGSLSLSGESIISGTGSPEGVVTASPGSLFLQDDGTVWRKATGTGNTGWAGFGGVSGSGTTNTLAKWTAGTALGNSIVSESGTALTVAGTISATVLGTHVFSASGSSGQTLQLRNTSSNAAAYTELLVANDVLAYTCALTVRSSAFASNGYYYADGVSLSSFGAGGLSVGAVHASGTLRQYWGGTTLKLEGTGSSYLPGSGYALNLGSLQKKYLTLHAAELWVETLVAQNTIATIGGRVLVAPTNLLSADLAAATTTITVKYNNLASGDRIYMEADAKVEFMSVDSAPGGSAGAYTYTVTRNLDGSGANDWFAGDAILNTGQTSNGFIDIYSVRGIRAGTEVGPTIVGNIRLSSTYNDWAPRWAIGNLDGLYGYSGTTFGVGIGNVAAANILIDDTNGIRIRNGTTTKIQFSTAGVATIAGWTIDADQISKTISGVGDAHLFSTYSINTGGGVANHAALIIGDGVANWVAMFSGGAGTDIALMAGGTTPTSAPFRVTFGGALTATNASISGAITSTSGTIGGWTIGATSLSAGSGATTVAMDSGGTNPAFYAGSATPGSAPFRVTNGGALTATSATITGNITATTLDANDGTLSGLEVDGNISVTGGGAITAGNCTLDTDGIELTAASSTASRVKWTDGSYIISVDDEMQLSATLITLFGITRLFDIGASTGSALVLDGSNYIKYVSSSLRTKEHVESFTLSDPLAILKATPIRFDYIGGEKRVVGFASEHLAAISPELVNRDAEGLPVSNRTDALLVYLLEAVRHIKQRIEAGS